MDCSLPGSSVHGILQARILEWVAISFSRGSSQARNRTQVCCIAGRFLPDRATKEALRTTCYMSLFLRTVLEWVAISFSRGSSQTRDGTWLSHIVDRLFTHWATVEAQIPLNQKLIFQSKKCEWLQRVNKNYKQLNVILGHTVPLNELFFKGF